jgi:hypothetical protein
MREIIYRMNSIVKRFYVIDLAVPVAAAYGTPREWMR